MCWRAQNEGFDVKYVGSATVYHLGGATLQETNPQKTFLNFRNSLLNVIKNVPKQWFLLVVFSRLLLDGIAGIKFLIELRPIHTWAIIKAHLSVYRNFYKFLQKRKNLQKKYDITYTLVLFGNILYWEERNLKIFVKNYKISRDPFPSLMTTGSCAVRSIIVEA